MKNPSPTVSDEELFRLMTAGDEAAFVTLYERRQGGVYRFALRMSGSETVAEDVTQEVFLALMNEGGQFDPSRGTVSAYMYGMARHRVLRHLERDQSFVSITHPQDEDHDTASDERFVTRHNPLYELTRNEMIESVRQAVLALPTHYREVVVLCSLHEMSYEEAAAILKCAVGTIRSRLNRARALLIEKLRPKVEPESFPNQTNPARYFL